LHHQGDCKGHLKDLQKLSSSSPSFSFPKSLIVSEGWNDVKAIDANGGWGDLRDIALCMNIAIGIE